MADVVSAHFRRVRAVVGHNGYNFDQIAMERDGIVFPREKVEDTLIGLHAFASHMPKRLDHGVSIYCDAAPWKIVFGRKGAEEKGLAPHKMERRDLWKYNGGGDVPLTAHLWRRMQSDLKEERRVYEHDKALAEITKEMQVFGIPVDLEKKEELSGAMARHAGRLAREMRRMVGRESFRPSAPNDVRWALFEKFGAPTLYTTPTGLASTSNAMLEELKKTESEAGAFAKVLAEYRAIKKVKSTYVDSCPVGTDGHAHFNWRIFGTVSGRWSCRLQSCPRYMKQKDGSVRLEDRPRELYIADPGHVLVYFDVSQGEMRAAAGLSGDVAFIKTCEGDVHAGNAAILFPKAAADLRRAYARGVDEKDPAIAKLRSGLKQYRDVSKNSSFGILYSAEIKTIFEFLRNRGFEVSENEVRSMFDMIHDTYWRYYEFCEENMDIVKETGTLRTAVLGRKRVLGRFPKPGDVYNYPVQGLIADVMNLRTLAIRKRLPFGSRIVAQIHDALLIQVRARDVGLVKSLISEMWAEPVHLDCSGVDLVLPVDLKEGERWSAFG